MKFYSSISQLYDYIFPYNPAHLAFIAKLHSSLRGLKVLDVGCSTGSLAMKLAEKGAIVDAIDFDKEMIEQAKAKAASCSFDVKFEAMDMLCIEKNYKPESFDSMVCFGNTLVHLSNHNEIESFFKQVYSLLKPNGRFSFQILNYSHIINKKLAQLPLIDNEHIRFERYYEYDNLPYINFDTKLTVKANSEIINNSIKLLAIQLDDLLALLKKSGFQNIEYFSNFKSEVYKSDSLSLVVNAKK
jgi:2-polyprenyl-3-methyl-5-hydroxy-6-metoxy-1,4-benzoquinol methylase